MSRLFLPVFVQPDVEEATISFYEHVLDSPRRPPLVSSTLHVRIIPVAQVLVIAGEPEALDRISEVAATFVVDSLAETRDRLRSGGAIIFSAPGQVAPAQADAGASLNPSSLYARHPDGTLAEYVQHDRPS